MTVAQLTKLLSKLPADAVLVTRTSRPIFVNVKAATADTVTVVIENAAAAGRPTSAQTRTRDDRR